MDGWRRIIVCLCWESGRRQPRAKAKILTDATGRHVWAELLLTNWVGGGGDEGKGPPKQWGKWFPFQQGGSNSCSGQPSSRGASAHRPGMIYEPASQKGVVLQPGKQVLSSALLPRFLSTQKHQMKTPTPDETLASPVIYYPQRSGCLYSSSGNESPFCNRGWQRFQVSDPDTA